MTRVIVLAIVGVAGVACQLKRPDTDPIRMLEPKLIEPALPAAAKPEGIAAAAPIRLLDTQARGHIGRRVLHQQPSGELTQDAVWRWSSAPDRYLDTALRLELASSPVLRLVDAPGAPTFAATLLEWHLESGGATQLVAAVEIEFTGPDRVVHTRVVRASEPVSAELPGDLAAVAGRLLQRLARDGLTRATHEP
jgi:hypothetical protein